MPIVKGSEREIDVKPTWNASAMLALENQSQHRLTTRPGKLESQLADYLAIQQIAEEARDATRVNMALFKLPNVAGKRGHRSGLFSYSTQEVLEYRDSLGMLPVTPAQVASYVKAARPQVPYLRKVFDLDSVVYTSTMGTGELNGEIPWNHFLWQPDGLKAEMQTVPQGTEFNNYLGLSGLFSGGSPVWTLENEGRPYRMKGNDTNEVRPTGPYHIYPGGYFTPDDTFFARVPDKKAVPDSAEQAN